VVLLFTQQDWCVCHCATLYWRPGRDVSLES